MIYRQRNLNICEKSTGIGRVWLTIDIRNAKGTTFAFAAFRRVYGLFLKATVTIMLYKTS